MISAITCFSGMSVTMSSGKSMGPGCAYFSQASSSVATPSRHLALMGMTSSKLNSC